MPFRCVSRVHGIAFLLKEEQDNKNVIKKVKKNFFFKKIIVYHLLLLHTVTVSQCYAVRTLFNKSVFISMHKDIVDVCVDVFYCRFRDASSYCVKLPSMLLQYIMQCIIEGRILTMKNK